MNLFDSLSVSASGLSAQRLRAQVAVENLANSETTRTAEGGPYRRRQVLFAPEPQESPFASALAVAVGGAGDGVAVSEIAEDGVEPDRRYLPGHPHADKDGYVAYPRINTAEEMVDLMGASRGYQANVSAMTAVKEMIHRSLDLMK